MSKAAYIGVGSLAKKVKKMYVGVDTEVPIYETTTTTVTETLSADSVKGDLMDSLITGSGWTISDGSEEGELTLTSTKANSMGNYEICLTAKYDMTNVELSGSFSLSTYGTMTIAAAGDTLVSGKSSGSVNWTGALKAGQQISAVMSNSYYTTTPIGEVTLTLKSDPISYTTVSKVQVGTEVKPLARKVKKGYVGVNGAAQLFFTDRFFEYTGDYTESDLDIDGTAYKLYALTSSGTLKCSESRFWMCGGGAKGAAGSNVSTGKRYGGGGGYVTETELPEGEYAVVIGAGGGTLSVTGGTSSISEGANTLKSAAGGSNDGTGGSPGGGYAKATSITATSYSSHSDVEGPDGAGVTTYPFGVIKLYPHCAGGGGGAVTTSESSSSTTIYISYGLKGGTNGRKGDVEESKPYGGRKGGGYGAIHSKASAGSFYGAGGGGGSGGRHAYDGGTGYQGVAYVLQEVGRADETETCLLRLSGEQMSNSTTQKTWVKINGTSYKTEQDITLAKGTEFEIYHMYESSKATVYLNGTETTETTFTLDEDTEVYVEYHYVYIETGKEFAER